MTVIVTLQDGDTDQYMRYGDTYIKHYDGTLDVVRDGAKEPHSYEPGVWTNVQGDEKRLKRSRFQNWFKREATDSVAP
ncbi:MAG: hypothetical protein WBZ15_26785 [Mycobacterium sp.]|uniref:hypothetical protein n=1 Tax=Mycobacterium sp. TaxID=1785 RepID=UPI003C398086